MRKKLLWITIFMVLIASVSAIYVEVGSGTATTNYIPAYGFYSYGWSRTIYPQSELLNEMEITSISYNVESSPNDFNLNNQTYYMRHTTNASIPSADYLDPATDTTYQAVFSGTVTYSGSGWHQLNFDTAFAYNGTDNLEIAVKNNMGSWDSPYPVFVGTSVTPERAVYQYADGTFPTSSGSYSAVYPNTRFHFTAEGEPSMALLISPVNTGFNITPPVELTWTNGADTDWVKVYFGDNAQEVSSMAPTALLVDNYTQESYVVDELTALTNYFWKIVSGNDTSQYLATTAVWRFTTASAEGSIVMGNGTEINTSLPMEPYWGYTISQTIYNQEWINIDNQRIEQISYYYNGNGAWVEDVQIYMAHTSLSAFADGNSWVTANDLMLVFDGQLAAPAVEGWITLPLNTPFNYNNTDNLLVAFEANSQGYSSSTNEFFGTTVTANNSIFYYSDSVNSDFVTPNEGTPSNKIPNTLLTLGDVPTTPQLTVFPASQSWPATIMNTTSVPVTFTMRNTGLGALTVNSVSLDQDVDFILTDTNNYPLTITSNAVQFTVSFRPLTVGNFTANVIINDSEIGDTEIQLTGSGYDAMLYDFPHFEGFENIAYGALPQDWSSVVASTNTYVRLGAVTSSYYEGEQALEFYNYDDANATLIAITPPIDNLPNRRIRFMGKTFTNGAAVIIGTAVNNSGDIQFTARDTISFTTEYQQYQHGFVGADEDAQFIAIKFLGTGSTYISIYLDSFYIETIPSGPAIVVPQTSLDFGDVYLNRFGVARLNIENWGIEALEVDFSQTGTELSFTPAELSVAPSTSGHTMVQLIPIAEGAYAGSFTVNSNDPNIPSITVNTIANILPPLPEGVTVIGSGTLVDEGLPCEPWYNNSYSQTIYYAGEIGISDQRIEKISWQYNGNSPWGPDAFSVYMGLTTETQFASNTSWINIEEMMEVYNGTMEVPGTSGFVEIELDIPFNYNTSQNLVVGVLYATPSYHNYDDDFYCTATDVVRSILYYNDQTAPNPAAPPTANYMRYSFPNVKLQFGAVPDAPDLTVYPSSVVYEMVPVNGSSMEKTFTMRSIGLQNVTIAATPIISGNNATEFSITTNNNTYPLALPFSQMATIGVTFSPTSEGSKSATIQIVDNATRETHIISLGGYAYADDGNDQATGATVLTLPVEGDTYAIMPVGDVDWYKIPAMGIGDTLMARTTMTGGSNISTKLWLYGPVTDPGNFAGSSYISEGYDLTVILHASGDYYLRVAETYVNPSGVNPHTRKNANGEAEREVRDDTGLYNLFVSANYNYDYNAPLNLEAHNQSGFVELTWVEPEYERYLTGYNIYRNNVKITSTMIPIGTNIHHDADVIVGVEYTYHVVGMYADPTGFSLPSNSVTLIYYNLGTPLWGDDFEEHPDFALTLPNWIQYDVDGGDTYGISNVEFENQGSAMSYIVFNPASTTPPITDMLAQTGDKFLASFASSEGVNNDWIITPRITIGTTTVISFYARSYTSDYDLERFKVKMSLGGDQVDDFTYTLHQGITYLEAPTEWTPFHFNVSQLSGNTARFAIQCVSADAFILMVDNFRVDSTDDGVNNESVEIFPQINTLSQNYPNPFNPETSLSFSIKDAGNISLDIYNIRGQKVKTLLNEHREAGIYNVVWNGTDDNNRSVASGIYFYNLKNGKFSSTKKMILMK